MGRRLAAAGLAATLGCATPIVDPEELPEEPIALIFRTLAQGRERAELLEAAEGKPAAKGGQGLMHLNEVDNFIDKLRGEERQMKPALQGRLALLYPRTRKLETLDAFVVGSLATQWSSDHQRLLVVSRHRGTAQLYEYSLARGDVARLMRGHQDRIDGSYGPDGRIAFVPVDRGRRGLRMRVAVTEIDGSLTLVTDGPNDSRARWSPDGRWLIYQSRLRNGTAVLKALDLEAEDSEPRVVARGSDASFSPRGDWVVYSRERAEGWRLWRMRPDGTGKTALGMRHQGSADERNPTVSPDGRFVVYVAEDANRQRIRIRRMDGTGDREFLVDGDGTLPIW